MSNLKSLTKAQLIDRIEQLERNAEDDRRRIGVMMYEQNVAAQRIADLESEVEDLSSQLSDINEDKLNDTIESQRDIIKVQAERIKLLSHKAAAQPKPSAPVQAPKRPAPKPQVPAQPIASPEAHEALRVFGSLTSAQRSAVLKATGAKVVNLGNVLEVQAKWHSRSKEPDLGYEAHLAEKRIISQLEDMYQVG